MNMFEKVRARLAAFFYQVMVWSFSFVKNRYGAINMMWIIGLVIGLTVAAALLPDAVVDITNTTLWTGAPASVLAIVPILGIGVIAALLYKIFKS